MGSSCVTSVSNDILDLNTVDDEDKVDDKEPKQLRLDKVGDTSVKLGEGLGSGIVRDGKLPDGEGESDTSETDMLGGNGDHQEAPTPVGDGTTLALGVAKDDQDLDVKSL